MDWTSGVGRRVELTEAGATLALRVGLFATAAAEILPPALRQVRRSRPGTSGRAHSAGSAPAGQGVVQERFSLAAPTGAMPGLHKVSLSFAEHRPTVVALVDVLRA
ncbi:hypothetical protein [Streptomyces sp. NPDC001153]